MATVRKTITLSDNQNDWIKSQLTNGGFTNDSEYIRDLVRRDQAQQDKLSNLKAAIADGIDSGISDKSLDEIWDGAEQRHRSEHAGE